MRGKRCCALTTLVSSGLIPAHAGKTGPHLSSRSGSRAHPRSRGENFTVAVASSFMPGSSPLTRGKLLGPHGGVDVVGLIPAHAGKTGAPSCPMRQRRAHPRSRGENARKPPRPPLPAGSSPLTRGKLCDLIPVLRRQRLIPAHAGKTTRCSSTSSSPRAHPRSRGENPDRTAGPGQVVGLIPAHAGKTGARVALDCSGRAHPRSRGENPAHAGRRHHWWGSSPLTRGKRSPVYPACHEGGLIPAHAGKTRAKLPRKNTPCGSSPLTRGKHLAAWIAGVTPVAHPRSRGENVSTARAMSYTRGSSPLTRGKLASPACTRTGHGLIPAHAGKTRGCSVDFGAVRAHPRSRGENTPQTPATSESAEAHPRSRGENHSFRALLIRPRGSSPLTRGKQHVRRIDREASGLIPAHAGKTFHLLTSPAVAWAHPRSRGENVSTATVSCIAKGSSPLTRGKL